FMLRPDGLSEDSLWRDVVPVPRLILRDRRSAQVADLPAGQFHSTALFSAHFVDLMSLLEHSGSPRIRVSLRFVVRGSASSGVHVGEGTREPTTLSCRTLREISRRTVPVRLPDELPSGCR